MAGDNLPGRSAFSARPPGKENRRVAWFEWSFPRPVWWAGGFPARAKPHLVDMDSAKGRGGWSAGWAFSWQFGTGTRAVGRGARQRGSEPVGSQRFSPPGDPAHSSFGLRHSRRPPRREDRTRRRSATKVRPAHSPSGFRHSRRSLRREDRTRRRSATKVRPAHSSFGLRHSRQPLRREDRTRRRSATKVRPAPPGIRWDPGFWISLASPNPRIHQSPNPSPLPRP